MVKVREGGKREGEGRGGPTCHSTNHFGSIVKLAIEFKKNLNFS